MKDFFKFFAAALLALFIFFIVFIIIVGVLLPNKRSVSVPNKAVLVFNLSRPISDKPSTRNFGDLVETGTGASVLTPVTLRAVLDSLEQAATDNRITALYLRGQVGRDPTYSGWATLTEVHDAILRFKKSNKPVIAFQENLDERTYYLTSTADKAYFHPIGLFELNGLSSSLLYYTPLLRRYGINVQAIREGKYKSAVEPFTRDSISPENQEQLNALLQDVYGVFSTAVSQSKGIQPDELNRLVQTQGLIFPNDAVSAKLVNALKNEDEVIAELRGLTGEPEPKSAEDYFKSGIALTDYYQSFAAKRSTAGDKIVVIYAEGDIIDGYSRTAVAADYLVQLLRKARLDKEVRAVVLRINSPGGSASASDKILQESLRVRAAKPFVVSMGSVAASGGYMIAMGGQRLFASADTITGSIGVFSMIPDISGLLKQLTINTSVVKTAPLADEISILHPLTDQGRTEMQRYIDLLYSSFISDVATGRNLPVATVQGVAQGRVWSGQRALGINLVGELGGLREAILAAADLAKITKYTVTEYQQPQGWDALIGNLLQQTGILASDDVLANPDVLQSGIKWLEKEVKDLQNYNDPHGVYARMPYNLIIK